MDNPIMEVVLIINSAPMDDCQICPLKKQCAVSWDDMNFTCVRAEWKELVNMSLRVYNRQTTLVFFM